MQFDVTLVLVWIGVRWGCGRSRGCAVNAARSPLDLRPLVETSVPREIAPVVVTLDRLFATLRTAAQSRNSVIADTSINAHAHHRSAGTA